MIRLGIEPQSVLVVLIRKIRFLRIRYAHTYNKKMSKYKIIRDSKNLIPLVYWYA